MAKRRRWLAGLLPAALLVIAACETGADRTPRDPEPVAVVDGVSISADVLTAGLRRFRREHGQLAFRSERDLEEVRRRLLDEQIERLLLEQAAERHGIRIDDDAVERALLRRRAAYPGRTFEAYLAEANIPLSELREEIRYRLLVQQLMGREVNPRVAVTDEEIEARFEADPAGWAMEDQVRARQIVVRTEDEARQILRRLRRGEPFAELAAAHSLGPESERGGNLGWFSRGTMPAPIDEVCFDLPVGRVSEVVESPYGYHLFEVTERREARDRPLAEVRRTIENELRLEKEQAAQRAFVERLKSEARIVVDEAILAEVR
jgi:peptidyl-prolyl cis-trans isomerase C